MKSERQEEHLKKISQMVRTQEWRENISRANTTGNFIKCKVCGKDIWTSPSKTNKAFCSYACYATFRKGKVLTEAHRNKLGEASKRYWKNENSRKEASFRSLAEKNPAWTGGKKGWWNREVVKRDDYTCQDCGLVGENNGFMESHHIKPKSLFPELKNELTNGVTVCPNCHKLRTIEARKVYGKQN